MQILCCLKAHCTVDWGNFLVRKQKKISRKLKSDVYFNLDAVAVVREIKALFKFRLPCDIFMKYLDKD